MRKVTQEQLNEIVRKHGLWLDGKEEGERADLRGVDLSGAILEWADLRFADLSKVYFEGANLYRADLRSANLRESDLRDANLYGANLRGADLSESNLEGTGIIRFKGHRHEAYYFPWNKEVKIGCQQHSLEHWLENYVAIGGMYIYTEEQVKQYGQWLRSLKMRELTQDELDEVVRKHVLWLEGEEGGEKADLSFFDLRFSDLRGANLTRADLNNVDLRFADLRGANLFGANLKGANLFGANLEEANLSTTNLKAAVLSRANLMGADLRGADLSESNLSGVNIRWAHINGIKLKETGIIRFKGQRHAAYYFIWNRRVKISCEEHTLEHWLENYVDIGKKHEYNEEDIKQYGTWLRSLV